MRASLDYEEHVLESCGLQGGSLGLPPVLCNEKNSIVASANCSCDSVAER